MRSGLIAAMLVLGIGTTAHAQQILSAGPLFGGPSQARAVCYIYNSGTTPLGLSGTQIASQFGVVQTLVVNQCGAALAPGQACGIAADIANNLPYTCKTVVSPNKSTARGVLEVRNSSQVSLTNVELR
jgi:hypothetical protein